MPKKKHADDGHRALQYFDKAPAMTVNLLMRFINESASVTGNKECHVSVSVPDEFDSIQILVSTVYGDNKCVVKVVNYVNAELMIVDNNGNVVNKIQTFIDTTDIMMKIMYAEGEPNPVTDLFTAIINVINKIYGGLK